MTFTRRDSPDRSSKSGTHRIPHLRYVSSMTDRQRYARLTSVDVQEGAHVSSSSPYMPKLQPRQDRRKFDSRMCGFHPPPFFKSHPRDRSWLGISTSKREPEPTSVAQTLIKFRHRLFFFYSQFLALEALFSAAGLPAPFFHFLNLGRYVWMCICIAFDVADP